MRIIARRVQPISDITQDILGKRKSQQEIIEDIKILTNQSPQNKFFTYLNKQYGKHEVDKFKEALLKVERHYSREKSMIDIYNQLNMNKASQMNIVDSPKLSIYAKAIDLAEEKSKFEKKIEAMKLPLSFTVHFSINDIYEPEPYIILSALVVDKAHRKEGVGSKFMDELINIADRLRAIVLLTPSSDFGGNVNKLRKFYSNFGFKRNLGRNKDYRFSEAMIRLPK